MCHNSMSMLAMAKPAVRHMIIFNVASEGLRVANVFSTRKVFDFTGPSERDGGSSAGVR